MKPAEAPHNSAAAGGIGSWVSNAIASMATSPAACATATTRNTLACFVASPPEKSPPPHEAAASRLSPEDSKVTGFIDGYDTWFRGTGWRVGQGEPRASREVRSPVSTATLVTSDDSEYHNKIRKSIFLAAKLIYNFGTYS